VYNKTLSTILFIQEAASLYKNLWGMFGARSQELNEKSKHDSMLFIYST